MINLKDMKFEEFSFSEDNEVLNVQRYYDARKEHCNLQLCTSVLPDGTKFFVLSLTVNRGNRTYGQSMELGFDMKVPKVFREMGNNFKEPGWKDGIDKKYVPFVISAINLWKEVHKDLFPEEYY